MVLTVDNNSWGESKDWRWLYKNKNGCVRAWVSLLTCLVTGQVRCSPKCVPRSYLRRRFNLDKTLIYFHVAQVKLLAP